MTDREIKAAITKGFTDGGLHPNSIAFMNSRRRKFCYGCAQGALWIGLGNSAESWSGYEVMLKDVGKSEEWSDGVSMGFAGDGLHKDAPPDEVEGHAIGLWARKKFEPEDE
jgi:hypothetical protein